MFRTGRWLVALAVLTAGWAVGDLAASDITISPKESPRARRHDRNHHVAVTSRLSVDVVKLKSEKTLRGAIVRFDPDRSLTMAVSREWLRKTHPDLFAKFTHEEASVRRAALEQLRDRVKKELEGRPEDSRLAAFLRLERKRIEELLADAAPSDEPQFVWVELTKKEIAKINPAAAEHRRIAAWSWSERLANVETRDAADLERQLKRKGIDPAQPFPDLSDRFPPRVQDDREWSARMALVAYAFDKTLDFQGTGDMLVRADHSANAKDSGPLIAKLLGGQVDSLLKDLLGGNPSPAATPASPDAWLKTAYRDAEREKARAFRATRLDINLTGRQASVYSVFAVHLANGDWETIWSDRETQDGTKERAAIETTITNDPQVKSVLGTLQSLGGVAGEQVQHAIRFGAATMAAQQAIDSRFFAFEGPFLQHLDGPPLWWTK